MPTGAVNDSGANQSTRDQQPRPVSEWTPPVRYLTGGVPLAAHSAAATEPQWNATTYLGPRRFRPKSQSSPAANRGLLAHARTLTVASAASRLTGLLRTLALAAALGVAANGIADPYNGANSFPNILYELLLGGLLSSVVIPLIVRAQERDTDGGDAYTQRLLSIATVALGLATLLAVLAAPLIAWLFVADPGKRELTSVFAALLLPEVFFYGLSALCAAVLNTRDVYGPPAWASVLNNLIVLVTLGVFVVLPGSPPEPTITTVTTAQILVLGIGTTAGIITQALSLLPPLRRSGFQWRWRFRAPGAHLANTNEARGLVWWVLLYVLGNQIAISVITRVAFSHNALSTFSYAALLFQLPYGVLGVSILTAIMPKMSRAAARGETSEVIADLTLSARLSAVALLPITAGLIALGPALTTTIFLGHTTTAQARLIGTVAAVAAFGLIPFALLMLQMRVFYALGDARTPTLINTGMVVVEVALVVLAALLLHGDHVVEALGASTSASYVFGAVAGHLLLRRRLGLLGFAAVLRTMGRIAIPSTGAGIVAYAVARAVTQALGQGRGAALTALLAGGISGSIALVLIARRMRITELCQIIALTRR